MCAFCARNPAHLLETVPVSVGEPRVSASATSACPTPKDSRGPIRLSSLLSNAVGRRSRSDSFLPHRSLAQRQGGEQVIINIRGKNETHLACEKDSREEGWKNKRPFALTEVS